MSLLFLVSCFFLVSTLGFWSVNSILTASTINDTFHPYLVIQNSLYILALNLFLSTCITKRDSPELIVDRLLSIICFLFSTCTCLYNAYMLLTNIVYDSSFSKIDLVSPNNWKPYSIVYVVVLLYGAVYSIFEVLSHVVTVSKWTPSTVSILANTKLKKEPWRVRLIQLVQWIALILAIILVLNSFIFINTRLWQDTDSPHALLIACISLSFYISSQKSTTITVIYLALFTIALSTSISFLFYEITNVALTTTWLDHTGYTSLFNATTSVVIRDKYAFIMPTWEEIDAFATGSYVQHLLNVLLVSVSTSLYTALVMDALRLCFKKIKL